MSCKGGDRRGCVGGATLHACVSSASGRQGYSPCGRILITSR
uniref:Uncharacterized protein n=1 Tax=Arundo donax TaxID=35708 RepID=A0A0A8Y3G6_ARUDO